MPILYILTVSRLSRQLQLAMSSLCLASVFVEKGLQYPIFRRWRNLHRRFYLVHCTVYSTLLADFAQSPQKTVHFRFISSFGLKFLQHRWLLLLLSFCHSLCNIISNSFPTNSANCDSPINVCHFLFLFRATFPVPGFR